jgi:hypothetical protein
MHPAELAQLFAIFSKLAEDVALQIQFVDAPGNGVGGVEDLLQSGRDANSPGSPSIAPLL